MKKPLAALLLVPAAVAALAVPAGAAVPKTPANRTEACTPDGSGQSAQIWSNGKTLAVENTCTDWLLVDFTDARRPLGHRLVDLNVAPGAHFNWDRKTTERYVGTGPAQYISRVQSPLWNCGNPRGVLIVRSYKNVRHEPPDLPVCH